MAEKKGIEPSDLLQSPEFQSGAETQHLRLFHGLVISIDMDVKELVVLKEAIRARPGCKMLQIGTAGGFTAFEVLPVLSEVGGTLVTVDIDESPGGGTFLTPKVRNDSFAEKLSSNKDKGLVDYHRNGSDDFFKMNEGMFDVIFVDGDHRRAQTEKDVGNSMGCLAEGGIIYIHDVVTKTQGFRNRALTVAGFFDDFEVAGWKKHHHGTKHGLAEICRT